MSLVLADTGALVSLLDRRERFHVWAVEQIQSIRPPMLVCEPVLAEVCFLLADVAGGRQAIHESLKSGAWQLDFSIAAERERVFALMATYADQPMSLADACLVRMAELQSGARVFTLDRQFRIYRKNRRQLIPLIIPDEI